jgi:hypothetical protein
VRPAGARSPGRGFGTPVSSIRETRLTSNTELYDQWSDWTAPQLAEGWIKRVLAGINPFNQRITDLFNNAVNTDRLSPAG